MVELDRQDLRIDIERHAFAPRPYRIKITHLISGIWARGEGQDMYNLERELCYRILSELAQKGKCDHAIGYMPGEWDNDGYMIYESDKAGKGEDEGWIFSCGLLELFNFCPNCGLPVRDIGKEAQDVD